MDFSGLECLLYRRGEAEERRKAAGRRQAEERIRHWQAEQEREERRQERLQERLQLTMSEERLSALCAAIDLSRARATRQR